MSSLVKNGIVRTAVIAACAFFTVQPATAGELRWQTDVRVGLQQSRASGKPMLIQFTADWCHYCRKMKSTTYADSSVTSYVDSKFIPVMLDADQHAEIVKKLNLRGLPATVIVAPDLTILNKLNGYQSAEKLKRQLGTTLAARTKVASVGYAKQTVQKPVTAKDVAKGPTKKPLPSVRPRRNWAFGGLSLVSLRDNRELVQGNGEFAVRYRDLEMCFVDEAELKKFMANPKLYWPKAKGQCQVSLADGKSMQGRPQYGVLFRDQVWMFESAEKMNRFIKSPGKYAK